MRARARARARACVCVCVRERERPDLYCLRVVSFCVALVCESIAQLLRLVLDCSLHKRRVAAHVRDREELRVDVLELWLAKRALEDDRVEEELEDLLEVEGINLEWVQRDHLAVHHATRASRAAAAARGWAAQPEQQKIGGNCDGICLRGSLLYSTYSGEKKKLVGMLCLLAASLVHLHHPVATRPGLASRCAVPQCSLQEDRVESAKAGAAALIFGSVAFAPVALLEPSHFTPQWELACDSLALMLGLFGVTYRYAARTDDNPMLKQGVVGAFAITRTLAALQADPQCTAMPLQCGAPLGYVSWTMITQGLVLGLESFVAFGAAAIAIEWLSDQSFLKRCRGEL